MKNRFLLFALFLGLFSFFSFSCFAATEGDDFNVSFVVEEGSELISVSLKDDMWEDIDNPSTLPSGSLYFLSVLFTVDDNVDLYVLKNGEEINLYFDPLDQSYYWEDFLNEDTEFVIRAKIDMTGLDDVRDEAVRYDRASSVLYADNAASVKIYDLTGRVVRNLSNVSVVELSDLPKGLYVADVDGKTLKFTK